MFFDNFFLIIRILIDAHFQSVWTLAFKMSRRRRHSDGSRLFDSEVCAFCGRDEDNELLYGKFFVSEDIRVHNNCMFFASGLKQREDEIQGFDGFLMSDIEAELKRGKKLKCAYCHKCGATVGCCEVKCKKTFHFSCGLEHGSLHQYFDSFASYCRLHAPKQKTMNITEGTICHICCELITLDNINDCLYSPCCKNSWFHKICLQKYALSAGLYFFKCPLCNNTKEFIKEMEIHGICIPDKDAAWELEENAFQDLLLKPQCDAPTCVCLKGRQYCPKKKSGWTLLPCSYCGYHARHKNCENIKPSANSWVCSECRAVAEKMLEKKVCPKIEDLALNGVQNVLPISSLPSSSLITCSSPALVPHNTFEQKESPVMKNISNDIDPFSLTPRNADKPNSGNGSCDSIKLNLRGRVSNLKLGLGLDSHGEKSKPAQDTDQLVKANEHQQVVHLKDIKNLSCHSLDVKKVHSKSTAKRVTKKQKLDGCNGYCIGRYFGKECCKFRI